MRSAEQDAVVAWKHVQVFGKGAIVDFRLRQQDRQLTFDRCELLVAEKRLSAETSAVHDDLLRQRLQVGQVAYLAHLDLAAGNYKILRYRRKIGVGLDKH